MKDERELFERVWSYTMRAINISVKKSDLFNVREWEEGWPRITFIEIVEKWHGN